MLSGGVLLGLAVDPVTPQDVWSTWPLDPFALGLLLLAAGLYRRGRGRPGTRRRADRWRDRAFVAALLALAVALLSPLDAVSAVLASAHMVQHVLLQLVAAPLLALAAPGSTLLRGLPLPVRRAVGAGRRSARPLVRGSRILAGPAAVWVVHVVAMWGWHAAVLYDAALRSGLVHWLEHATFLATGVLLWRVVVSARSGADRVVPGAGIVLLFGTAMAGVLLSLLLTFANEPFYTGYGDTQLWGLTRLGDQQLAGVILWIPGSVVYVGTALALLAGWLRRTELAEREAATAA